MGTCWTWIPLVRHAAGVDEIMKVLWSDYYGAALFGDEEELVCLPHKGCRLEIVATAESSHREVNLILPGQVIRYNEQCQLGPPSRRLWPHPTGATPARGVGGHDPYGGPSDWTDYHPAARGVA